MTDTTVEDIPVSEDDLLTIAYLRGADDAKSDADGVIKMLTAERDTLQAELEEMWEALEAVRGASQITGEPAKIIVAAICNGGLIYSLPKPAHHGDVLKAMYKTGIDAICEGVSASQGFLTSKGVFVRRREAAAIAVKAGQITEPQWLPYLYSEDLW